MRKWILALALAVASPTVWSGAYVGGLIGISSVSDACDEVRSCESEDFSFGTLLGYQFAPGFALEAHLMRFGVVTVPGARVTADGLGANLLAGGRIFNDETELFVMGGMMRSRAKTEVRAFGRRFEDSFYETEPYVGIVLNFRATSNMGARIQYMRYLGDDEAINVVSAGLTFR